MKKLILLVGLLALVATPVLAEGALVAYWNFNLDPLPGGGFGYLADPDIFPMAANAGIGNGFLSMGGGIFDETIVSGAGNTLYRWIQSFGGTTINALFDDPTGGAISPQGGTRVGEDPDYEWLNNGGYMQLAFNMTNKSGLNISYATQRTTTGFTHHTWSWSTDGVVFNDFEVVNPLPSSFGLIGLQQITDLDGVATAFLRLTFTGANGPTGNNRIDNLILAVDEAVSTESKTLSNVKSLFR